MVPVITDEKFSREQCFQLYALFGADPERTAHALNIRPEDVVRVATECEWDKKLAAIIALKKSVSPGDLERSINRALSFVQAHRLRLFLDRVLLKLSLLDHEELTEYIFTGREDKMGCKPKQLSTRALCDLASSMEKCSAMAAQALCDTAQDRSKRDEEGPGDGASGSLHAQIAAAMANIDADCSPSALLFDAQVATAKQIADRVVEPSNPNDSDDH